MVHPTQTYGASLGLTLACALALSVLAVSLPGASGDGSVAASQEPVLATIERAGPVAPATVRTLDDPAVVLELERELGALPPSTRGFPRWLVHVFSGAERQRSYAVFDEDLARFPALARAVRGEVGREQYLYRVELPGAYWEESGSVVDRLAGTGSRPLFHQGARSNWPWVEVILTEQVEAGGPPSEALPESEREARDRFMERVGPLLRNKSADRTLDASYDRLADQLYGHHRELSSSPDVTQFYARYRRYRWRGDGGSRVAVRAEYRTPDRRSAGAIDAYFRDRATRSDGQLEPRSYGIEVLSDVSTAGALEARLRGEFPDLTSVRAGRPLFE